MNKTALLVIAILSVFTILGMNAMKQKATEEERAHRLQSGQSDAASDCDIYRDQKVEFFGRCLEKNTPEDCKKLFTEVFCQ